MNAERSKILYIDDRPEEIDAIVASLKEEFNVTVRPNANKAREELLKHPYDVVLLDYEMVKQGNADKILAEIRKENYHIKVIMVTAKLRNIHELARVLNFGISKCYFKDDPVLLDKLREGILEVVENRDAIIMGLESWLSSRANKDKKPILVSGNKKYTAKQLLEEIKKNSKIGKNEIRSLVLLAIRFLNSDKTK